MNQFTLPSALQRTSRPSNFPVYVGQDFQTLCSWEEFWNKIDAVQAHILASQLPRWIVATENPIDFAVAVFAVLRSGRVLLMPANLQAGAIQTASGDNVGILTDEAKSSHQFSIPHLTRVTVQPFMGKADISQDSTVILYTSGSTGEPTEVVKRLGQLERELENLHELWGGLQDGKIIYSSVSHRHLYGVLFYVLLPLCEGNSMCAEPMLYPESLSALSMTPFVLAGSPAFYKRMVETNLGTPGFSPQTVFFSSGGSLASSVAEKLAGFGVSVYEIYGSTETGGIAWREAKLSKAWTPFSGIQVRTNLDERIEIASPYLPSPNWFLTGDRGYFDQDSSLHLLGRADTVVKIEEKRVSLSEVEKRLKESAYVADARVVFLSKGESSEGRQYLASAIVLTDKGLSWFGSTTKLEANRYFRDWLITWFEPTVLPRKWRFIDKMPADKMGKTTQKALMDLFMESNKKTDPDVHSVELFPGKLQMTLSFDRTCVWFDGHFKGAPVLPGVAQFDWLMRATKRYMQTDLRLLSMSRIKFTRPILPARVVSLEIEISDDQSRLSFRYFDQADGLVFSSGKINVERSA